MSKKSTSHIDGFDDAFHQILNCDERELRKVISRYEIDSRMGNHLDQPKDFSIARSKDDAWPEDGDRESIRKLASNVLAG